MRTKFRRLHTLVSIQNTDADLNELGEKGNFTATLLLRPLCITFFGQIYRLNFIDQSLFERQETKHLSTLLCIASLKEKFEKKYFNLYNKELTVEPVKRIRKRIR